MKPYCKLSLVLCLVLPFLSCAGKPSLSPLSRAEREKAVETNPPREPEVSIPVPGDEERTQDRGSSPSPGSNPAQVNGGKATDKEGIPDAHASGAPPQKKESLEKPRQEPGEKIVITSPGVVNIRSGPGPDYAIIAQAGKGESFEYAKTSPETYQGKPWYEVLDSRGRRAFIWSGLAQRVRGESEGFGDGTSPFERIVSRDTLTPPLPEELKKTREISLNFEAVDIREIIQTFCELLKLDYIVEPGVAGDITLHTSNKIPVRNLFKMFEQILALNNVAIIKKGNFYHFLPMPEAKRNPLGIYHGKHMEDVPNEDRLIIQIIPLKYIASGSLKAMIAPLLSKNAHFINLETSNTLIVVELASNMRRLLEIINALDVNSIDKTDIELYSLNYSDAREISRNLREVFTNLGYKPQGPLSLKFVPLTRLNSILVVSSFPHVLPTVEFWIKKLDQPMVEGRTATFVYYLQNAEAAKIAGILKGIYGRKKTKKELREERLSKRGKAAYAGKSPFKPKAVKGKPAAGEPRVDTSQGLSIGEVEGKVVILPDKDTNSLIIRTDPKNYPAIEQTIKKLDLMPLQVLIEVMILDVTLDNQTSFGLEWAFKGTIGGTDLSGNVAQNDSPTVPASDQPGAAFASGAGSAAFFIGSADKVISMIRASGLEKKTNVLSSPMLITSDNKDANISITDQIPVKSATLVSQTGGEPITQETIEYHDVGIKLKVKPKINDRRFVNMQIDQEVSSVDISTLGSDTPRFFTRSASTNVVVKDKETVVVGGLMKTTKGKTVTGIPYLSKIPLLGMLFKSTEDNINKSELLIFITPHVITNYKEGRTLTREFREKLQLLKRETKNIKIGEEPNE